MPPLVRPYIEAQGRGCQRQYYVRCISGVLASRPFASDALLVWEEQEALWKAKEVVPNASPSDPSTNANARAGGNSPSVKGTIGMSKSSTSTLAEVAR